jgi:hypothetical protein
MTNGSLIHFERNFAQVGWFIPPYMQMGKVSDVAAKIEAAGGGFSQADLQQALEIFYEPYGLAAMVLHRYPIVPMIRDYKVTIREAVEAHFLGLDHVAAGGLVPVIEGVGRRLALERNLSDTHIKDVFTSLAADCKNEVIQKNIGAVGEIVSMLDSFRDFTNNVLFVNSKNYPFDDGTNRHGIAHGAYSDADYGSPINFYKVIAAIDFLTFVASFRAHVSWFAPDPTPESFKLSQHYLALKETRAHSQFYT